MPLAHRLAKDSIQKDQGSDPSHAADIDRSEYFPTRSASKQSAEKFGDCRRTNTMVRRLVHRHWQTGRVFKLPCNGRIKGKPNRAVEFDLCRREGR